MAPPRKTTGSRSGSTRRKPRKGGLLSREQQREIIALGLLGLALFLLLALIPVEILGTRGAAWFPAGNAIGVGGATIQALATAALGLAALSLPILLAIGGLRVGDWISPDASVRGAGLVTGLILVAACTSFLLGAPEGGGWLGRTIGDALTGVIGWLGTLLLLLASLVVLLVATIGWNPLRPLTRGAVSAGGMAGRAAVRAGDRVRTGIAQLGREGSTATPPDNSGSEEARDVDPGGTARPEGAPAGTGGALAGEEQAQNGHPAVSEAASDDGFLPDPVDAMSLGDGTLPPMDLLEVPRERDRQGMERKLTHLGQVLVEKIRSFGVEGEIGGRTTGPVVTQFEVVPAPGVKVNRIANLDADLALAMKARSIRIVAPIPGKGAVGVEIPNPEPEVVHLREILEAPAFQSSRAALPLALGKDLTGRAYVSDLARMPHVLIAGATGSGKSVCLNTFITSLVYRHTPESLRLLLVDPKMVELSTYSDLPHLRHPVVTDPRDAAGVLKWAVLEMERRYELLSANGVRSLDEFNGRVREGATLRYAKRPDDDELYDPGIYEDGILPYVVLVVDELADLMMTVQGEVERPLTLLAQKARAIGIHLMVATQRPSVNVITGLIKANFPCRIAFRVASKTDSRTILDQNGADALLGNGDMLFLPPGQNEPIRIQGAFIPTSDTDRLTGWFRSRLEERRAHEGGDAQPSTEDDILEVVRSREAEGGDEPGESAGDRDELFHEAAQVCVRQAQGSTSLLQRRLRIGYGRAARIVDQLHEAGVLGPPDGSKPREVLIGLDELEHLR